MGERNEGNGGEILPRMGKIIADLSTDENSPIERVKHDLRKRGREENCWSNICKRERNTCRPQGGWHLEKAVQPQHPREGELRGQIEAAVQKGEREFLETEEAQNGEGEPVEAEGAQNACVS